MKKTLLILALFLSVSSLFSQSDLGINFCENPQIKPHKTVLSITQLSECSEITANNKNLSVVSFSIGMMVGEDFKEIKITGNKLTEKSIASIKKYNPSKIYIEKIKLSSKKGTIQSAGHHTIIFKN